MRKTGVFTGFHAPDSGLTSTNVQDGIDFWAISAAEAAQHNGTTSAYNQAITDMLTALMIPREQVGSAACTQLPSSASSAVIHTASFIIQDMDAKNSTRAKPLLVTARFFFFY
jgi:hypothetical protein